MFSQSRFEILALTDVEVIGPWPSLGVHLTGGVYLMGVYLMGVYLMGMYVMGVYLTACISRVCTSWA
jgi:hypothetical protein